MNRLRHHFAHIDRVNHHLHRPMRENVESVRLAANEARERGERCVRLGAAVLLSCVIAGLILTWVVVAGRE